LEKDMQKDYNKQIVERFEMNLFSFISEYTEKQDRFLLAVSGGMDSMVMLDLFERLSEKTGICFCVANMDHRIRKESEFEQSWLREYCREKSIPFFEKRMDIPQLKEKAGARQSVEQIAREQRYEFFTDVRKTFGADWILTAHHRDDLLETFLLRLLRGTGLNGLSILNKVERPFLRPLIDFWRNEIECYCGMRGLHYFEDETNADEKYMRNRIRKRLIPFICESFGETSKDILIRDLNNLKSSAVVIDEYLSDFMKKCTFSEKSVSFDEEVIKERSDAFIGEWLIRLYQRWNGSPIGLTNLKIRDIISRLRVSGDFEITISEEISFFRGGRILSFGRLTGLPAKVTEETIDFTLKNELLKKNVIYFNLDAFHSGRKLVLELIDDVDFDQIQGEAVYVDFDKLDFPLTIRFWREGDRFKPLGMKHYKRISRFFTDRGITKFEKREQLILEGVKHDIICCIGLRSSEDYRVNRETVKILKIEYK